MKIEITEQPSAKPGLPLPVILVIVSFVAVCVALLSAHFNYQAKLAKTVKDDLKARSIDRITSDGTVITIALTAVEDEARRNGTLKIQLMRVSEQP